MKSSVLFEDFEVPGVLVAGAMQELWANGWRHFGRQFFRYNLNLHGGELQHIVPLRIDLRHFDYTKSQRRIMRKNAGVTCEWKPASVTPELEALFQRHKERFYDNIPSGLHEFLSAEPATTPCRCEMLCCRVNHELAAVSYCDVDEAASSSVYGMFEPAHAARSPGIFTLLKEIERSMECGRRWHYLGYASIESGIYDYKKGFKALEGFEWESGMWKKYPFSLEKAGV